MFKDEKRNEEQLLTAGNWWNSRRKWKHMLHGWSPMARVHITVCPWPMKKLNCALSFQHKWGLTQSQHVVKKSRSVSTSFTVCSFSASFFSCMNTPQMIHNQYIQRLKKSIRTIIICIWNNRLIYPEGKPHPKTRNTTRSVCYSEAKCPTLFSCSMFSH